MIPSKPPPTLNRDVPDKWSPDFHSFVEDCLQKDPANRPSAEELMAVRNQLTKWYLLL